MANVNLTKKRIILAVTTVTLLTILAFAQQPYPGLNAPPATGSTWHIRDVGSYDTQSPQTAAFILLETSVPGNLQGGSITLGQIKTIGAMRPSTLYGRIGSGAYDGRGNLTFWVNDGGTDVGAGRKTVTLSRVGITLEEHVGADAEPGTLFRQNGALFYKGGNGTVTQLAMP